MTTRSLTPLATASATFLIFTAVCMFKNFNIFPTMSDDFAPQALNEIFHGQLLITLYASSISFSRLVSYFL